MKKRILSFALIFALIISSWVSVGQFTIVSSALTTNQQNIVNRANYMYNMQWQCLKTIDGWRGQYTFTKGNTYRIPYGQPIDAGYYVGYGVEPETFLESTKKSSSVFYTKQSKYGSKYSTYYASDCSAFVSWCWSISRTTTSYINNSSKGYGKATSSNIKSYLKVGDALNYSGSHVVLVTDITYNSSGSISKIEITEQTPPQLKRTTYTVSELANKYSANYTIQRYTGTVKAAPTTTSTEATIRFQSNGGSGTMSDQKVQVGNDFNLPSNEFTKKGYQFIGWVAYRASDSKYYHTNGSSYGWYTDGNQPSGYTKYVYAETETVDQQAITDNKVITMYAIWGLIYGDVDGSGTTNITDVTIIQKAVASITSLSTLNPEIADVDGDAEITIRDATYIQLYVSKRLKKFPVSNTGNIEIEISIVYYPACPSSCETITQGLDAIGVDSSYAHRTQIAEINDFVNYSGTAEQNTQMLNLLKKGLLIKSK